MNEERINKITNELVKRIEERFQRSKKLRISSLTTIHKNTSPFRETFQFGFWLGDADSIVLYFYSITEVTASVISSNLFSAGTHQFIDVESDVTYDEAREIYSKVRTILSEKFEIEYYDDDDDYYDDEL